MNIAKLLILCSLYLFYIAGARADFVYMGGTYDFAPFSSETSTLPITHGRQAMMPCNFRGDGTMQFTSLISSPFNKDVRDGQGFIIATPSDTVYLIIKAIRRTDYIYGSDQIELTKYRNTEQPVTLSVKDLSEIKDLNPVVTIILDREQNCSVLFGRNETLLWEGVLAPSALTISGVGYFSPGQSRMEVSRACLNTPDTTAAPVLTHEQIAQLVEEAGDPYSGYWSILDYTLDTDNLKSGGYYHFALIPGDSEGYNIIYLSGADIYPSSWIPGTAKGELAPTGLAGVYSVKWIDAEHTPLPTRGILQFISTDICQISFPSFNSSLRLHRIRK